MQANQQNPRKKEDNQSGHLRAEKPQEDNRINSVPGNGKEASQPVKETPLSKEDGSMPLDADETIGNP